MSKETGLSAYVFGQVPPQALNLEEVILGAILTDKEAFSIIVDILRPESFYSDVNAMVFKTMMLLYERSHPIDILTVTEEIKKIGRLDWIDNGYYLTELSARVASSANIEFHARIVKQKFIERQLIKASCEVIKDAYDPTVDTFDVMEQAEKKIFDITQDGYMRNNRTTSDLAKEFLGNIKSAMKRTDGLTGIPSGFMALDRVTAGWQASDLIIVAARPGMGKSAFMLSSAMNAAKFEKGVAIFSLEMSAVQLVGRMASQEAQISGSDLRSGRLNDYEFNKLHNSIEKITSLPIFIDDTPAISVYEIRAKCRRLKMKNNIQMVIVDYLQLVSIGGDKNGNRDQEMGKISSGLKALAKELNVPVIALSQLSRAVEVRGGAKRPQLSDLRESGNIEQDADIVTFIYRPEYYKIKEDDNGISTAGLAEIIIAKHRNGALDTVGLRFIDKYAQFTDFDFNVGLEPAKDEFDAPFQTSNVITRPKYLNGEDVSF